MVLATAPPSACARPSIVRLPVAEMRAVAATVIALLLVTVEPACASPIETKPPPPLVDRPDTRPTPSVTMLTFRPDSVAPDCTASVTLGVAVADEVAACTLMKPPPPPMADAVTVRSPDGAPTKLSVPVRSISWMPVPGAISITNRCSPLPTLFRSTPCIWNVCEPAVRRSPGLRLVMAAPLGARASWKLDVVRLTTK